MDTPSQTDCSRESSEDEVFAPRVTVGRDLQRWEEGSGQPERAKVRLGGQRPWDGRQTAVLLGQKDLDG